MCSAIVVDLIKSWQGGTAKTVLISGRNRETNLPMVSLPERRIALDLSDGEF